MIKSEGRYGGPKSLGHEYAVIKHKETSCVVDGEDTHPTHHPLPNVHNNSPKLSTCQKRVEDGQSVIQARRNIFSVTRLNLETINLVRMFLYVLLKARLLGY